MIPEHADNTTLRSNPYYKDGYYVFIGSKWVQSRSNLLTTIDLVNFEYHFTTVLINISVTWQNALIYYWWIWCNTCFSKFESESNRFLNVNSSLYLIGKWILKIKVWNYQSRRNWWYYDFMLPKHFLIIRITIMIILTWGKD